MEAELAGMIHGTPALLHVVDVDAFPDLASRWGDLVPVLFAGTALPENEVCHYHLDRAAVRRALQDAPSGAARVAADPRIG